MKITVLSALMIMALNAQATLLTGELKSNKGYCSVDIVEQNKEAQMYTVELKLENDVLHFYNKILPDEKINTVEGLFKKERGNYQEVIGAPIFPMGTYYQFTVKNDSDKKFTITKETYKASIVVMAKVSTKTDVCEIK